MGSWRLRRHGRHAAGERSTRSLALSYLIYRGKVLRADRSGVGAHLLDTERLDVDIGFSLSLPARSSDVPARRGIPNLGTLVEFEPRLKVRLAEPTQHSRLRRDWRAFAFLRYDNYTGAASRASPLLRQNSGTSAGIGLMWTWQRSDSPSRGPDG